MNKNMNAFHNMSTFNMFNDFKPLHSQAEHNWGPLHS